MRMNTLAVKPALPWPQIALILLFPALYWLNGLAPWSTGLWQEGDRSQFFPFWGSTMLLHWASLALAWRFLRAGGWSLADIGLKLTWAQAGGLLAAYLLVAAGAYLLAEMVMAEVPPETAAQLNLGGFAPRSSAERQLWILNAFSAGFCEEVVYRGFGIRALESRGISRWLGLLITSVSFVFIHGQIVLSGLDTFGGYLTAGLLFGLLYLLTRRLWPGMLLHMLIDVLAMLAVLQAAAP
jgi:hypothetical protein